MNFSRDSFPLLAAVVRPRWSGIIALIWAGAVLPSALATQGLPLEEALRLAETQNESLRSSSEAVEEAQELKGAAEALAWPRVELRGRAVLMDDPLTIDLSPIRSLMLHLHPGVPAGAIPQLELNVLSRDFYRAELSFGVPLYTGGKIKSAREGGEARVAGAQAARKRVSETLAADVTERYFGLRLAMEAVGVRREVRADLERHVFEAHRLEAEGQIAHADILHAEVALAEADRALKRVLHDEGLARVALADLLGLDEVQADPTTPFFSPREIEPLEFFRTRAQSESPILAELEARNRTAAAAERAARAERRPEVVAFGTRQLRTTDLTVLDPKWLIGIEAKYEIFDGTGRSHRIGAAAAVHRELSLVRRQAERDVDTAVERFYREIAKAREQYQSLAASRALAEENLRVRRRGFEEGLATSIDVVDAQTALTAVRLETLSAARDFDVSLARLFSITGLSAQYIDYLQREGGEVPR